MLSFADRPVINDAELLQHMYSVGDEVAHGGGTWVIEDMMIDINRVTITKDGQPKIISFNSIKPKKQ